MSARTLMAEVTEQRAESRACSGYPESRRNSTKSIAFEVEVLQCSKLAYSCVPLVASEQSSSGRGAADNAKKKFYETGAFGFYHVLCGEPGRCTALTFLRPFGSKRAELERGFPPSRLTTSSLLTLMFIDLERDSGIRVRALMALAAYSVRQCSCEHGIALTYPQPSAIPKRFEFFAEQSDRRSSASNSDATRQY